MSRVADISAPPWRRRDLLRGLWGLAGIGAASASAVLTSCRDSRAPVPGRTRSLPPPTVPGSPGLGAHGLVYNRNGVSVAPLFAGAMHTQATGSTLLACVGRGAVSAHAAPTDTKANVYAQAGTTHTYSLWRNSGTALYVCERAAGGPDLIVTASKPKPADETTLSVVEVTNGGVLRDVQWAEVLAGNPLTSPRIATTGPAMLIAWWWGDADVMRNKTAVPDNGFAVIDEILLEGELVQCAVAVRQVGAAGSYQVTWNATPRQGAQLWIAAVQSLV